MELKTFVSGLTINNRLQINSKNSVTFTKKSKNIFQNNFLKICLEQLKLSDHIELEK